LLVFVLPDASVFVVVLTRLRPSCTLFPYTTLFRSDQGREELDGAADDADAVLSVELVEVLRDVVHERRDHPADAAVAGQPHGGEDRKSTRLNSSHVSNSYAVFCLKKQINII